MRLTAYVATTLATHVLQNKAQPQVEPLLNIAINLRSAEGATGVSACTRAEQSPERRTTTTERERETETPAKGGTGREQDIRRNFVQRG